MWQADGNVCTDTNRASR